ncbi:hypothetical protein N9934_05385 [Desulfosarcina sp.]|nr:hypothetical protein [Desulfosarcina sp.]
MKDPRETIDFTFLKPNMTKTELHHFVGKALEENIKNIYIPLSYVKEIRRSIGPYINIGTTAGFPYGYIPLKQKLRGIKYAAKQGADWVDICLDITRANNIDHLSYEIASLHESSKGHNIKLKLIIETPYLNNEQIYTIARTADGFFGYIKTATGINNKVTLEHVKFLKQHLHHSKIKAAGGIKTLKQYNDFLDAGADIIGSSNGFKILEEYENTINSTSTK